MSARAWFFAILLSVPLWFGIFYATKALAAEGVVGTGEWVTLSIIQDSHECFDTQSEADAYIATWDSGATAIMTCQDDWDAGDTTPASKSYDYTSPGTCAAGQIDVHHLRRFCEWSEGVPEEPVDSSFPILEVWQVISLFMGVVTSACFALGVRI